ncbi:MAG: competence protein ComEC [Firmicutes bacterium]|nr:competence protein ComEC [Bacillota bacterium]
MAKMVTMRKGRCDSAMERPLVLNAISVFMGALSAMLFAENLPVGALLSASFLCSLYLTIERRGFLLVALFFALGVLSFWVYFGSQPGSSTVLRVTGKKYYYFSGEYRGRKVIIKGDTEGLAAGDSIAAKGSFEKDALPAKGILGTYYIESYERRKPDMISSFYGIKRDMHKSFSSRLGEEDSSVLMALCFGDTSYLTKSQMNEFNRLGVIHAISVSGFHMAVIYGMLEKLLGAKAALALSALYALFTGMQAATLRAFLMIFISKMSKFALRNYDSISSIAMAALCLLVLKPWYPGDIGFMLSFLSTLGIILYYRKFTLFFWRLPRMAGEAVSICLSAQLFSLPYIAFTLEQFSPGFILGNLFLMPFYSVLVVLGNIALLCSAAVPLLDLLCRIIGVVMSAMSGADHMLLGVCPPVTHFGYLYGVSLMLIYLSFIFYKKGHRHALYYPVFVILFLSVSSFSFFPEIYYRKLEKGGCAFVEYRNECVMVCNYDHSSAYEIYRLKEDYGVTKVVSNVRNRTVVELGGGLKLAVYPAAPPEEFSDMDIFAGGRNYRLDEKSVRSYEHLYVIIFNRLLHFW